MGHWEDFKAFVAWLENRLSWHFGGEECHAVAVQLDGFDVFRLFRNLVFDLLKATTQAFSGVAFANGIRRHVHGLRAAIDDFIGAVVVRSYDEELIANVTTDEQGELRLPQPEGEYYLMFDPGHEDPAEFDYAEF